MAVTPTKNSTSPVLLFAVVILGFIIGYFYYEGVLKDQAVQILLPQTATGDTLAKFKDLTIDFGPLDDLKFKTLRIFGESPVQPGATGKIDLFSPF